MFESRGRRAGVVVAVLVVGLLASLSLVASASALEPKCGPETPEKIFVNPEYVGFQTSKGELDVYEKQGGKLFETGLPMAATSSPDTEITWDHLHAVVAFQGSNGHLWTYTPYEGCVDTGNVMRTGTGASGAATAPGQYVAAFQSSAGQLWNYTAGGSSVNTSLNLAANTSPSALETPSGHYVVAYQSSGGQLWDYTLGGGTVNTGWSMAANTSPSAVITPAGNYIVAFQSSVGSLAVYTPTEAVDTGRAMSPGTSPSGVQNNGIYVVAFRGTNGDLWTFSPTLGTSDTGYAMLAGTSPSIGPKQVSLGGGTPKAAYVVYFQGTNGHLWRYAPYFFPVITDTGYAMREGTSPGVASIP